ncbi:MAG: hypothetical protein GF331_03290 [Chitinivibrionales bacterium]|nr:hypothetical protein [Chitinivibrionales bacterium]
MKQVRIANREVPMQTHGARHTAFILALATLIVTLPAPAPVRAATITLDQSATFQTIEGFGTSAFDPQDDDPAFIDMMVNDLGMTALRLYIDEDFEINNDNADPNSLNLSGCNLNGSDLVGHMRNLRYLKDAGLDKLMLTVFSPPAWMKTNGSTIGGKLRTDMYDEFAEYYTAFIKYVKQETGIDVYALSPENEPAWEQWYWSCVYTPEQMRDITKVLGRRLDAEGLSTEIAAAEDLISNNWGAYFGYTNTDPEARDYLHSIAVHAYEDGVAPSSGSATRWGRLADAGSLSGKSTWMTETSGYSINNNWLDQDIEFGKGAFTYACAIYSALRYANLSLWLWLAPNNPSWGALQEGMCHHKNKTNKYYVSKQYYRYIRPGAVRIGAESDDASVYALAFEHAGEQTLTVVLLNTSSSTVSATVTGVNLPQLTIYRSSETEQCANVGTSDGTVALPPKSIATLYGEGHTVGVRPAGEHRAAFTGAPPARGMSVRAYGLDGRLIGAATVSSIHDYERLLVGTGATQAQSVRVYSVTAAEGNVVSRGAYVPVR